MATERSLPFRAAFAVLAMPAILAVPGG